MTLERAAKWCQYASIFVMLSGVFIMLGAHPATRLPPQIFADIIYWPYDSAQTITSQSARLLSAIGGGIMVGWGLTFWMLSTQGFREAPALSRRIILTSIITWFVLDSTASLAAGAPLNVVSNLFYLGIFVWPLWRLKL